MATVVSVAERRLDGVRIKVDGSELPRDISSQLKLVHVEESVHAPDTFNLHFNDPEFKMFDAGRFTMGTRIEIFFQADGKPLRVTSGEVTAISVRMKGGSGPKELVVTGLDQAHRLLRGPRSQTFVKRTYADIVNQIAGKHGLTPKVDDTGPARDHVFQHNETDYAFLRRIAGTIGFNFWVSEKVLHFKAKPAGPVELQTLAWGKNLKDFSVRFASMDMCSEVEVVGWDTADKRTILGRADNPDLGTAAPAAKEMAKAAEHNFGKVTRRATQFPVTSQSDADDLAKALLAKASGEAVTVRGEANGNPKLAAGGEVILAQVGQRLAGKYRMTSVVHEYGVDQPYVTSFVCGGKDSDGLLDLLGGGADNGEQHRGWGGLVRALVTNNNDKDGRRGRVKVKYPTQGDEETDFIDVVSPGAGGSRGMQWLPEVGDQVLVGFESDDKQFPVVLGGLWSRKDPPPNVESTDQGKVVKRVLASRKGHRLELIDDPKSSVTLMLGDSFCALHLEESESSLTGVRKLTITASEIKINADKSIELGAPEVKITASGALTVTGKPIKLN